MPRRASDHLKNQTLKPARRREGGNRHATDNTSVFWAAAMIKKEPINARIDAKVARALKTEAKTRGQTTTELLEQIINDHQTIAGPTGAERRIVALEATVKEQERIVRRHTGRNTPRKRRISLAISHEAAQRLEKEASAAGMSKSELVDNVIMHTPRDKRLVIKQPLPALNASV